MKFTAPQLEILHILWSSETLLSLSEIAERTKYRFATSFIVRNEPRVKSVLLEIVF